MIDIERQKQGHLKAISRGAYGFFWIAALTLFSSYMTVTGATHASATSLGVVQIFAHFVPIPTTDIAFSLLMAGLFATFGVLARNGNTQVFIIGMTIYAIDAGLLAIFQFWIAVAVHAYALYRLYPVFQSSLAHTQIIQQEERQQNPL